MLSFHVQRRKTMGQIIANLQFDGVDNRDLIDVLIEVINITKNDGQIPSVEVAGKRYSPFELTKLANLLSALDNQPAAYIGMARTAYAKLPCAPTSRSR